ncbi:Adenylate and Guanylate cyclase catalytic domain containing protein [Tritrichomonas foetus]|uniref:Adenylate and Guanylate cyclase catalytic domain containing protein n=1 Tax=Tritrichomonas foetus TaxID=1144522 RepID=A0A1J4KGX5_9EUKA|nr:Adenylate and Guanylate cyclase catalytic domain containing protein [Tritrichomonas foetus]|eukprot:OHT08894.1 Adenylate and Guanylate cyclase catalytic domain containing protein [Tritrichomonas foetus]
MFSFLVFCFCSLLPAKSEALFYDIYLSTVLSGDFKKARGDSVNRDAEFFHAVVLNLPDAVIVANSDGEIEHINKAFSRILGLSDDEAKGKQVNEFMKSTFHNGNIDNLFANAANDTTPKSESVANKETISYSKSDQTEIIIEATSLNINNHMVIIMRDTTQTVRYNTLINEEKRKSDVLLGSILPASLVKRVQAGEKNISFAVQTATIVFMDIVSFTPWCGSLPADKVMLTLNALFKKDDVLVAKYPTMTKIKCIGDCYMAAGGVFSEINHPAEHSKEVVSFGLDALDAINELNDDLGEHLQIRVGVNTGGPIVAGVLGVTKPTFEILGPAINMAQQMEHHGVSMQVHVSRSVYELIYGDAFVIKERGSIEVKGGSVITYLVSRKK